METISKYGLLWGKWKPVEFLGGGSFGKVYRVCDQTGLQKDCAAKLIRVTNINLDINLEKTMTPEQIRKIQTNAIRKQLREIQLMDNLNSAPNIVTIHDSSIQYGSDLHAVDILLRMELLTSLTERIKERPLDRMEIITLGIDICSALASCERFGIVHFDIKPGNILIDEAGRYKLGDFGLSKNLREGSTSSMAAKKGTPHYMSPEAWHPGQKSTYRSDQYSLGIVLYQLLNDGKIPFCKDMSDAQMCIDAINQRLDGTPFPPPADDAGELWEIIQKACAYDEADRYPNATEMRQALRALAAKEKSEGASTFIRLSDYMKQQPVEPDSAAQIGLSLCSKLIELEKEQKIHCEISPDQILISETMDCRLLPPKAFCLESDMKERRKVRDLSIYMAPEGLTRGKKVSYQTDQYALGMILYQLLNQGKLPFCEDAANPDLVEEAVYQILDGEELPRPVDAGDVIWMIIQRACALNETDRFSSVEEIKELLQDLVPIPPSFCTLTEYTKKQTMSPEAVQTLGASLCSELIQYENEHKIHCEICPEHILLDERNGTYTIKPPETFCLESDLRERRKMRNVSIYMAPEGLTRGKKVSYQTDQYALGMVLYQLLNQGKLPFCEDAANPDLVEEAVYEILDGEELPRPSSGSNALWQIIQKACALQESERYGSAREMQQALKNLNPSIKRNNDAVLMVQKNDNKENNQLFDRFPASSIKSVIFKDTLADAPKTASDLSEKQNRSVLGWMENDTLYFAGNGGVTANQDSSCLFSYCTKLERIEFNHCFDTSNVTNMYAMFGDCSSLTSLDISRFNTSKVTNMRAMFYNCGSLASLDVSRFDTSNVTNMSAMFQSCSLLTSLDVSRFDTSNVTNMRSMFNRCSSLTSLDVSRFDTSNVTVMDYMFNRCRVLSFLDVSNFNTSNVTNMKYMFNKCRALSFLDVSNFNTSNVTNMSAMFQSCSSLTSLDVSRFDTSNVTAMDFMFNECKALSSLDVSRFRTSNVTNMRAMFQLCSSLTSLDVSRFDTSNVTNMNWMFNRCSSLTSLDVSGFNTSNAINMEYMFNGCPNRKALEDTINSKRNA